MRLMKTAIAASVMLAVSGCASFNITPDEAASPKEMPNLVQKEKSVRSYIRISSPKHQILNQTTRVNRQDVSIADALMAPKGLEKVQLVAKDPLVDLMQRVDIRVADMTIADYLEHLGFLTNYEFNLDVSGDTPVIEIASMITQEWDLAAMSNMPVAAINAGLSATISSGVTDEGGGTGGGGASQQAGQGSGTTIKIERKDDVWADTLSHARTILGVTDEEDEEESFLDRSQELGGVGGGADMFGSDEMAIPGVAMGGSMESEYFALSDRENLRKSWVVANKRLGTVTAYGKPNDIKRLDDWLANIEKEIHRQVFLDVAILDVTTAKGQGYGVDWNAVYNNSGFQPGDTGVESIGLSGTNSNGAAMSIVDGGAWAVNAAGRIGSVSLDALINALQEEGSVTLQSQPKITVTNGYTAYLGATEEISYVSNIEILPVGTADGGNSDSLVTTQLSRVSVGLKLAVTPRVKSNGDILLEVVPILSSIKGFTDIDSGGQNISTPNIAIQELATQVITKSGQPVHLGGLILSRIIENAKRVPLPGKFGESLGKLLGSMKIEEEGKELLIVITPTEVGT